MLLHVWVANVQITSLGAAEAHSGLLLVEVDVAIVLLDSLGLVEWLREAASSSEWVRTGRGGHVVVLALESLGVDRNGLGLVVVAAGNSLFQLIISCLLGSSVDVMLNDELVISGGGGNELAILGLHDLAADLVSGNVLLVESLLVGGVKVALLATSFLLCHSLLHLLLNNSLNL